MNVKISQVGSYIPLNKLSSREIEDRINQKEKLIVPGSLEKLFGVKTRYFAAPGQQCSDLAATAARKILERTDPASVDCLIYASACGDLIEPATANIVQHKLGLRCPAFDVKNACNSFLNGILLATSLIQSGVYKKVLITSGEVLNHSIQFNISSREELLQRLAAYSLGDAGAAILMEASANGSGIKFHKFQTLGEHWELCTVPGGGSMHPHDPSRNYFEGKTSELQAVFKKARGTMFEECFEQTGWSREEIDHVFLHQVSTSATEAMAEDLGFPVSKVYQSVTDYGNTGAASIPLCISLAVGEGRIRHGDKIMVVGLAAGISLSVLMLKW
jgi:3-oxoacyl-(acyl-carrier-protein) synthase III